jgi:DNA-binding winged helix-turn-helix (wHTH) protein
VAVRFGSFELAADARRLTLGAKNLHLTPKAFDLLMLLVEAAPRVVPKAELHARLWPDSFVADTTLVGLVKEVRRVLDDSTPRHPIIRTVARVGYAFARRSNVRRRLWSAAIGWWPTAAPSAGDGVNVIGREPARRCGSIREACRAVTRRSPWRAAMRGSKTSGARTVRRSTARRCARR